LGLTYKVRGQLQLPFGLPYLKYSRDCRRA